MKSAHQMIAEEAAKGIAAGIRDFVRRSMTITVLLILLAGSAFANWKMLEVNARDRTDHRAELKEYADTLNKANRLMIEMQTQIEMCIREKAWMQSKILELEKKIKKIAR